MSYDLSVVRALVTVSLGDDELSDLCFDAFPPVYQQFAAGQTKSARVRLLVDHAYRHRQLGSLIDKLKALNADAYAEFASRLVLPAGGPAATPPEDGAVRSTPALIEQTIGSLAAEITNANPVQAHKKVRALHNLILSLERGDPVREKGVGLLKTVLALDLGGDAVSQPVRAVRQAAMEAIKSAANRELGFYFRDGELAGQDLWAVDFSNADLRGVSFKGAFLIESDFANAELTGADFSDAQIRNAKFNGATVAGADFAGADWFNALGWEPAQLNRAKQPLPACPRTPVEFHAYLKGHYGFPFDSWSDRVQQDLVAAWAEYTRPGGLRDAIGQGADPASAPPGPDSVRKARPTEPKKPAGPIKVLFLAANPTGTAPLALDEEAREIDAKIRLAPHGGRIDVIQRWAVRPDDLLQSFNQFTPDVVHFSGHGTENGELILLDSQRSPKPVSEAALVKLFQTVKGNIRVVLINACFSQHQADAISRHIDCVIGMNTTIGDAAAIIFAASFYRALAFGLSVSDAFEQGKTALMLEGIAEESTPQLIVKSGVDAGRVVLIPPADRGETD